MIFRLSTRRSVGLVIVGVFACFSLELRSAGREAYDEEALEESEAVQYFEWEERFAEAHALLMEGKNRPAFRSFKRLALEGHAMSQHLVGVCFLNGLGVGESSKRASKWFSAASEAGNPLSNLVLAEISLSGDESERNYQRAKELLEPLVSSQWNFPVPVGDYGVERNTRSRASYLLGSMLVDGQGIEKDLTRGTELLILASNTGDSMASMYLSMAYAKGEIVDRDLAESKRRFEMSDAQSFDLVQRNLEASLLQDMDEAIRTELESAMKELSKSYTQALLQEQTDYAREILEEGHEGYDPSFARALLKMASDSGDLSAQYLYGRLLALGVGGEINYELAREWLSRASEEEWVLADFALGVLLLNGWGGEVDLVEGRRLLDRAAELGFYSAQLILDGDEESRLVSDAEDRDLCIKKSDTDVRAAFALARRKERGWLVEWEGKTKAIREVFKVAADAGYARAEHAYAEYFYYGAFGEKDFEVALRYFKRASDQGHAQSYFKVGYIYDKGLGVTQDFTTAEKYYEMSIEFGDPWAANNLGAIYTNGWLGVKDYERDYEKAMELYLIAVEGDNPVACYNIAEAYRLGRGREKDMTKAVEWYSKAAELGDDEAVDKLLELGSDGKIWLEPSEKAYWTEKAAEMGNHLAMLAIARMYQKGEGVPKSQLKAALWVSYLISQQGTSSHWIDEGWILYAKVLMDDGWQGHDPKEAMRICRDLTKSDILRTKLRGRLLLAVLYLDEENPGANPGRGVSELRKTYREASKLNGYKSEIAEAAYRLSRCYAKGLGVRKDEAERFEWMKVSADVGYIRAKYNVARYLIDGVGVDVDISSGVEILDTLSRKQFGLATLKLGELLRDGVLPLDGREEILERLRELSSHGERRARKILQDMGLEEHIAPSDEQEEQELKRYSPAVYG